MTFTLQASDYNNLINNALPPPPSYSGISSLWVSFFLQGLKGADHQAPEFEHVNGIAFHRHLLL